MSDQTFIKRLHDARNRAHEAAREVAERAQRESRVMRADEQQTYDRANAEIAEIDATTAEWREDALERASKDAARRSVDHIVRPRIGDEYRDGSGDSLKRFYEDGWASRNSGIHEVDFSGYHFSAPGGVPRVE